MASEVKFSVPLSKLKDGVLSDLADRPLFWYKLTGNGRHDKTTKSKVILEMQEGDYNTLVAAKVDTDVDTSLAIIVHHYENRE